MQRGLTSPNLDSVDRTRKSSLAAAYDACVSHLAECLFLVGHRQGIEAGPGVSPASDYSSDSSPFRIAYAGFQASWRRIWAQGQQWYHERPSWLRPILHVSPLKARQIDQQNQSSFPMYIYTSPMALLANATYHIACLSLLRHKPRPPSLPAQHNGSSSIYLHNDHTTSPIWHAQQVAGIATSNDFMEQWDPILVAGLLVISRSTAHNAQQLALLECMQRMARATGIRLDDEIESLQRHWKISR